MPFPVETLFTEELVFFILVGFAAQLVDGTLGMAYGISANTLLLNIGISPIQASACIHIAEVFTTGISGISHHAFGNVDISLIKKLILPGMIGAICGVMVLIWLPAGIIKTVVSLYLLFMGGMVLYRAYQKNSKKQPIHHRIVPLGLFGGFFDAAGGGGWGTFVASSLVARGSIPRLAVGTVNAAEFFVALTTSLTFIISVVAIEWQIVLGLALGGVIAAPFAAYFTSKIPAKLFMIIIGCLIILLSLRTLSNIQL